MAKKINAWVLALVFLTGTFWVSISYYAMNLNVYDVFAVANTLYGNDCNDTDPAQGNATSAVNVIEEEVKEKAIDLKDKYESIDHDLMVEFHHIYFDQFQHQNFFPSVPTPPPNSAC